MKIFLPDEGKYPDQILHTVAPIADQLMLCREDIEDGLFIGTNCTGAIKPTEVIPGREDDRYAKNTALRWGVINQSKSEEDDSHCSCHRIASLEVNPSNSKMLCHFKHSP